MNRAIRQRIERKTMLTKALQGAKKRIMQTNNFHRLMEDEVKGAPPLPPRIKQNVQHNMGFFQFLGKTVELYVPRAIDAFLASLGSSQTDKSEK